MRFVWGFMFLTIASVLSAEDKKRNEACTTPLGKDGKCVPLSYCPDISSAVSSKSDTFKTEFIRRSHCGLDEVTLVCCENPEPVIPPDLTYNALRDTTVCGIASESPRIWGGEAAKIGEFPWLVTLEYKYKGKVFGTGASGSLISDEFVLTAATCFTFEGYDLYAVRLGELNTGTDPDCVELVANKFCADPVKVVEIERTISHPLSNIPPGYNDIGLIQLKNRVRYSMYIRPICLAFPESLEPQPRDGVIIAGWGATENFTYASKALLKVEIPIVDNKICKALFASSGRPVGTPHLCAGGTEVPKGIWKGDEGVPLMRIYNDVENETINWYQYGIMSYGKNSGPTPVHPDVFTRVSSYIDWIASVIRQYRKKQMYN